MSHPGLVPAVTVWAKDKLGVRVCGTMLACVFLVHLCVFIGPVRAFPTYTLTAFTLLAPANGKLWGLARRLLRFVSLPRPRHRDDPAVWRAILSRVG